MKRFSMLVACAATLALALCLAACASSGGSAVSSSAGSDEIAASESAASAEAASSESAEESDASSSAAVEEEAEEASSGSAAEAGSGSAAETAGEAAAGFDFVDECIDEHGNATLYALTELKGWQLETLLDQQEYEWDQSKLTWIRPMDGASFCAYKETGFYDQDTYNAMNEKGGAIVAVAYHEVAGYQDPQAALKGNAKCVVEDSYFDGDEGIAIFYGPSMKEYLAIISPNSESTAMFTIFSKEAVGSGMADEVLGYTVGGSFDDVWKTVTGKDSYGH